MSPHEGAGVDISCISLHFLPFKVKITINGHSGSSLWLPADCLAYSSRHTPFRRFYKSCVNEGVTPYLHLFYFLGSVSEIINVRTRWHLWFFSPIPSFYRWENRHRKRETALRGRVRTRIPISSQHQAPPL